MFQDDLSFLNFKESPNVANIPSSVLDKATLLICWITFHFEEFQNGGFGQKIKIKVGPEVFIDQFELFLLMTCYTISSKFPIQNMN